LVGAQSTASSHFSLSHLGTLGPPSPAAPAAAGLADADADEEGPPKDTPPVKEAQNN